MTSTNQENVIRFYTDLLAHGEGEAAGEILAPGYVDHGIAAHEGGQEAFVDRLVEFHVAFGNRLIAIEDVSAEDDHVVVRWSARLTHTGRFAGYEPSGEEIETNGVDIFRIEDGCIAERWNHRDGLGLIDQLHLRAAVHGFGPAVVVPGVPTDLQPALAGVL